MPRPVRCRRIKRMPVYRSFSPDDITDAESVQMTVDEFELLANQVRRKAITPLKGFVDQIRRVKDEEEIAPLKVDYVAELEKKVTNLTGRYCKIQTKGQRKTVSIEYGGEGDLEKLLSVLCGQDVTAE